MRLEYVKIAYYQTMRQRRVFIAINLPEKAKKELYDCHYNWPDLPVRWTKPENLHITLSFLGYITDEELLEIIDITKKVAEKHSPFHININKISYGPPKGTPRMIWAEGQKTKELSQLQNDLEASLIGSSSAREEKEGEFFCHITLGRIKQMEFRQMELEERPQIQENVSFDFPVNSIEIMESELKRGGPDYSVLESFELTGEE